MTEDLLTCKICGKSFNSIRGKHLHISKTHKETLSNYYKTHYPKKSKLYLKPIKFKDVKQYFSSDFINREELIDWCSVSEKDVVSDYIKNLIIDRVKEKNIKHALSEVELELCEFPNIDIYKKFFGSYLDFCKKLNLTSVLNKKIPENFFLENCENIKIFIDTREQKPITFKNQELMKLDFGDYTCASPHYDYTYIDRKSEGDFKSTLSGKNFDRFKRELDRARNFNSYVFVVVESSISKIKKNNVFSPYKSKLPYIWHNLKLISQEYKDCCQFVFAENRSGLKKLIPKILFYGKDMWKVDVQYFLNKKIKEKSFNNL